jgi:peptide/nickel transport system permease protein
MLDVLGQDYIRTARAKGLSGYSVIMRHAFRNSLLPIITLAGLEIPQLFAGAIITEFVFNWHGMGQLTVNQAESGDLITVVGIMLVLATLVVIGNIVADLAYTLADPRITFGKRA